LAKITSVIASVNSFFRRFPIADFSPTNDLTSAMPRLRIVTYNIAHGRGLAPIQGMTSRRHIRANLLKIARLLADLKPDVVALQEIDEDSRWAGNFNHLEFLREFAGFDHAVFGINNRRAGLLNLNYGNAFLSRHPITEAETIAFGRRRVGEKGFLFVEIDFLGRQIPFTNMHLHYGSRLLRVKQVDRFLAYLCEKQRDRRHHWAMSPVVCGDLNNTRHSSDATATLLSHLHDYGDYTLHPPDGGTFPSPLPTRGLDFVFLPPEVRPLQCQIPRVYLSDHLPVVVDFDVP
jgi:endonuclease/exonuclease/phosphatase family metal-dependent hydrolase